MLSIRIERRSSGCGLLVLLGLNLSAACSADVSGPAPDAGPFATPTGCPVAPCALTSSKPRQIFAAPPVEIADLVAGNTSFALALYGRLRNETPEANLFYSPHSISSALAMAYAGARGNTATEMANALAFNLPQPKLHAAFNALDQELVRRAEKRAGPADEPFRLTVANALWGAHGFDVLPEYLDLLAVNYGAGLQMVDFRNNNEGARLTINKWIEEKTEGRIQDLIKTGGIDPRMRLILTNAIYFKAAWVNSFPPENTVDRPFQLRDGRMVQVPTMAQDSFYSYLDTGALQALTVPFVGEDLTLLIVAPKAGTLDAFEAGLTAAAINDIVTGQARTQVVLRLPKFKFGARVELVPALARLGMSDAFDEIAADFAGISRTEDLLISRVVHQAFVGIDEKGAEAAAATAVFFPPGSVGDAMITFNVDRPFLFFIRDQATGAILFVGRILDPTQP